MPSQLIFFVLLAILAPAQAVFAQAQAPQAAPAQTPPGAQATAPVSPQAAPSQPPQAPPAPQKGLAVVIVDPAHGGTDQGARGASGIVESDVVLGFARLLRISLESQGLRVILTRQANEDPSFDDRSKLVNAQRGAIYISVHVSSTGQPGTVRVYSIPRTAIAPASGTTTRATLVPWDRAQFNFIDQSRRLAELIQIQMAQRFRGSSETPFEAPARQLRTVAAPAVAIEVSSVSLPNRSLLDQMGPGIADGTARAVAAFRTIYETGGK